MSLEQRLATLTGCGITLAPGAAPEALLGAPLDRAALERDSYRLLLTCMGGSADDYLHRAGVDPDARVAEAVGLVA